VPAHHRMRAIDRDLIRGGHYGQRPRVTHSKAEHMAAPTKAAAYVKKILANSEPSTHGTKRTIQLHPRLSAVGGTADIGQGHLLVRMLWPLSFSSRCRIAISTGRFNVRVNW
jgi:hypothetical protein